jgi:hypothetical protein
VRSEREDLPVELVSCGSVAELFVRLRHEREDERIVLIGLLQLGERRPVVAAVERDVASQ